MAGLRVLIGNTPLLQVDVEFHGRKRSVWAKAENLNLTGSIKDRMAFQVLRAAYEHGLLLPGATIVEATSGNTGISFAALGRALGHPVVIYMPDWMNDEQQMLLRSYGAELRLVSAADGGFLGSIAQAEEFAQRTPNAFLPRQFSNDDNVAAHEKTTGPELWAQMRARSGREPDVFVAGVGTGGTIMGVGRYLRGMQPRMKLHPVEPASSPTLTAGHKIGSHRIQGISDEFIPPIVHLTDLDAVIAIDDGDAILMAQKLAADLGLGVGISSGANFLAALEAEERLGDGAAGATVFADSNKKYLSTGLMQPEPERPDYLTPHVKLLGFHAIGRVCDVCFDASAQELLPIARSHGTPGGSAII
jgi:cysteine synthase A